MNITKISNLNFYADNRYSKLRNNKLLHTNYGLKMSSPLKVDTLSFKGTPKAAKNGLKNVTHGDAINIFESVNVMNSFIGNALKQRFAKFLVTNENPSNILTKISVRTKSPKSIRYKAGSNDLYNTEEIYDHMTDLVAGRLVLNAATKKETGKILQEWINAIKDKEFELIELEIKRPFQVKKDKLKGLDAEKWDYAYSTMIDKLVDSAEKSQGYRANHLPPDYTKSNYPAIHLLVKFPKKIVDKLVKEHKIEREIVERPFEIQILGHDVNIYKDLDDLFYKIFDNKMPDEEVYGPFIKEALILKEPGNASWLEKFQDYRRSVFIFQRDREADINHILPTSTKKKEPYKFPIPRYTFPRPWDMDSWMALKQKCEADAAKKAAKKQKK